MYKFYINDLLLPVTPSSIKTKISGANKTIRLADEREINLIKAPGLTEWDFDFELPFKQYGSFVTGDNPRVILDMLEQAKINKQVIKFIIIRQMYGESRFQTNADVTVEDYTINEDSDNNSDITINIRLKMFKPYKTKHMNIPKKQINTITKKVESKKIYSRSKPRVNLNDGKGIYTVKHGDCLYDIAIKNKINGGYKRLYELNKKLLDDRNSKEKTSKYTIYTGQKLRLR